MSLAVELTILGKSPAMPDVNGANSGYLIRHGDFTLLLDCGSGVFSKLRALSDPADVDAVLITHVHADHTIDLVAFSHALSYRYANSAKRPALWGPPGSAAAFAALGAVFGAEELIGTAFSVAEYDPPVKLTLGPLSVSFARVPHYVPTWACDLRAEDGRRLTFGADCGPNDAIAQLASGTDLLMLESTEGPYHLPAGDDGHDQDTSPRGHISAREAGEMAAAAGAARLLLTHYSDELDAADLLSAAGSAFAGPILLAAAGERLVV